jgi:phosphoglycolate phosphatase
MGLLVADIAHAGIPLSLATSKPELPATLMLEHFTIAHHFDIITGASADEVRSAKADVVAEALVRLKAMDADLTRPIMIGDRVHDVEGAAAHGIPTIAVTWGYGEPAEWAHARAVAHDVDELRALLGL